MLRRDFLKGLTATTLAAPSIVRASSLMSLRGTPLFKRQYVLMGIRSNKLMNEFEAIKIIERGAFFGRQLLIIEDGKRVPLTEYKNDTVVTVLGDNIDRNYKLPTGFSAAFMSRAAVPPMWSTVTYDPYMALHKDPNVAWRETLPQFQKNSFTEQWEAKEKWATEEKPWFGAGEL